MKKKLTAVTKLIIPENMELVDNLKKCPLFYPEDIRLEEFSSREILIGRNDIAGIGHLQALLHSPTEIPKNFERHVNLAPGSIFKKNGKKFIPALISDNGFIDAVALSNRDDGWEIILIEISSPININERVIMLE